MFERPRSLRSLGLCYVHSPIADFDVVNSPHDPGRSVKIVLPIDPSGRIGDEVAILAPGPSSVFAVLHEEQAELIVPATRSDVVPVVVEEG